MSDTARVTVVLTERPQRLADLAERAGLSRRETEAAIEAIRKAGLVAICSGQNGVWLARSVDEYEANIMARRRRIASKSRTVRGERALLRRMRGHVLAEPSLWE